MSYVLYVKRYEQFHKIQRLQIYYRDIGVVK